MEVESGLNRSIIDDFHSPDIQGDQMVGESMVLLEVSVLNFILRISKEIKWKVMVVLLEVSLRNFILGISKETKWMVEEVLLELSLMNFILGISKEVKWKVKAWFLLKYH